MEVLTRLHLSNSTDQNGCFCFQVLHDFCNTYYFSLMKEILLVLTDRLHRSGFKYQTLIFMALLRIVAFGLVHNEANGLTQENVT